MESKMAALTIQEQFAATHPDLTPAPIVKLTGARQEATTTESSIPPEVHQTLKERIWERQYRIWESLVQIGSDDFLQAKPLYGTPYKACETGDLRAPKARSGQVKSLSDLRREFVRLHPEEQLARQEQYEAKKLREQARKQEAEERREKEREQFRSLDDMFTGDLNWDDELEELNSSAQG